MFRARIELAFCDSGGRTWVRTGSGRLQETKEDPATYYGLHEPLPWQYPEAATG